MMMNNFDIEIKDNINLYLFGSSVFQDTPSDIDIAIIYDKDKIGIAEAVSYRKTLEKELSDKLGLFVDTILLSTKEEKEMEFLSNAKHKKINNTQQPV